MLCRRAADQTQFGATGPRHVRHAVQLNHIARSARRRIHHLGRFPLDALPEKTSSTSSVCAWAAALPPLFAMIAFAIKLDSQGTVFFVQKRAGMNGRPFRMIKFRTMVSDAEALLGDLISLRRSARADLQVHSTIRA